MDFLTQYGDDGKLASPKLKEDIKNYLIDIDGTICEDVPNEQPERMVSAGVLPGALERVNGLYDSGNIITFFTSRTDAHKVITEEWLSRHGFKYHGIIFNKPRGGNYIWVDDRDVSAIKVTNGTF